MRPQPTIAIDVPDSAKVLGELYESTHPDVLLQDVLEIQLPNDIYIDVRWYPEHDPAGCFWIRMYQQNWENQIGETIKYTEPQDVKGIVELLAAVYCDDGG